MSIAFDKMDSLERTYATPSPCLANEFYEFFATPKLVSLLVALAWP